MSLLSRFIPEPRLREVDHVDVGAPAERAYAAARHVDLGASPIARALFALRTRDAHPSLRIDDLTAAGPGFRILGDEPGVGFAVGAIGKVWRGDIPFIDVPPERYAAFDEPGYVKVAWEIRCEALPGDTTRIVVEVRATATDEATFRLFRRYFRLIGPFSRLIRRDALRRLRRDLGPSEPLEERSLPGDELVSDASGQMTHAIEIAAPPEAIWPWLVQMGCGRGGYYSYDRLDNAGIPSADAIVPELQALRVGDEIAATPRSSEGFVVRRLEPPRLLLLSGTYDLVTGRRVLPSEPRPETAFAMSWAFLLEPLEDGKTRLVARVRGAYPATARGYMKVIPSLFVHPIMQRKQLRNIRARAEGRQAGAPRRQRQSSASR
jgi:hypothetical protein